MHPEAEDILQNLLLNDEIIRKEYLETHKIKNDPRITNIGKFLRKTSLDEVPQFFNVLRGEMTLVGPRPGLITQRELLELRSKCGLEGLRPGLTGLAQITYRDSASDRLKAKVDALYLKNAGFCLDIWILTRTLLQVFFPVNVHH